LAKNENAQNYFLEVQKNNSIRKINRVTEKIVGIPIQGESTGQDQIGMNKFIINKEES
jgi:hypothetical protein